MKLLVIRHARAGERKKFARESGVSDDLRPLTIEGRKEMKRVAAGLAALIPDVGLLLTSPLVRGVQTADVVRSAVDVKDFRPADALRPERHPRELVSLLRSRSASKAKWVAVVGHEPHLSRLVSWATTGMLRPTVVLEKGGACLLEYSGLPRAGKAVLHWLLTPRQLTAAGVKKR